MYDIQVKLASSQWLISFPVGVESPRETAYVGSVKGASVLGKSDSCKSPVIHGAGCQSLGKLLDMPCGRTDLTMGVDLND